VHLFAVQAAVDVRQARRPLRLRAASIPTTDVAMLVGRGEDVRPFVCQIEVRIDVVEVVQTATSILEFSFLHA
jgi:hypothetical protein